MLNFKHCNMIILPQGQNNLGILDINALDALFDLG